MLKYLDISETNLFLYLIYSLWLNSIADNKLKGFSLNKNALKIKFSSVFIMSVALLVVFSRSLKLFEPKLSPAKLFV